MPRPRIRAAAVRLAGAAAVQCTASAQLVHPVFGAACGEGVGHMAVHIVGVAVILQDGMFLVVRSILQDKINMVIFNQFPAETVDAVLRQLRSGIGV